jgi:hypothetical protein
VLPLWDAGVPLVAYWHGTGRIPIGGGNCVLDPGQLLSEPPEGWARDWAAADPGHFTV